MTTLRRVPVHCAFSNIDIDMMAFPYVVRGTVVGMSCARTHLFIFPSVFHQKSRKDQETRLTSLVTRCDVFLVLFLLFVSPVVAFSLSVPPRARSTFAVSTKDEKGQAII
jgi:hypothetical protein